MAKPLTEDGCVRFHASTDVSRGANLNSFVSEINAAGTALIYSTY